MSVWIRRSSSLDGRVKAVTVSLQESHIVHVRVTLIEAMICTAALIGVATMLVQRLS